MAYGDFKDLPRRTAFNKMFYHKALNIAKNLKHDGYQRRLAKMVYNFFLRSLVALILQVMLLKIKI